jgi:NAD(P)H-hydrate repair Nnr-like enzyme with NAD(P)H-hydrate epimerase domain
MMTMISTFLQTTKQLNSKHKQKKPQNKPSKKNKRNKQKPATKSNKDKPKTKQQLSACGLLLDALLGLC